jgi:hypothetical protein
MIDHLYFDEQGYFDDRAPHGGRRRRRLLGLRARRFLGMRAHGEQVNRALENTSRSGYSGIQMTSYDLGRLDPRSFEHLVNALAMRVLGGPDYDVRTRVPTEGAMGLEHGAAHAYGLIPAYGRRRHR